MTNSLQRIDKPEEAALELYIAASGTADTSI